MDEVSDDMEIKTNYENPYEHVPESESNNRVIKERFRIAYYQFTYKNIPRIMIRPLVMNVTWNLNLFPTKVAVAGHYRTQIIMSHRNCYY